MNQRIDSYLYFDFVSWNHCSVNNLMSFQHWKHAIHLNIPLGYLLIQHWFFSCSSFHEFLKRENEVGNITRQEAVSMVGPWFLFQRCAILFQRFLNILGQFQWYVLLQVPPLFLNVQPDHRILDSMLSIILVHQ